MSGYININKYEQNSVFNFLFHCSPPLKLSNHLELPEKQLLPYLQKHSGVRKLFFCT